MTGTWRDFRPAIWLAMLGVAVMLLFSPFYFGAVFIGAAIGVAVRINQRRRRAAAIAAKPSASAAKPAPSATKPTPSTTKPTPRAGSRRRR